ncbi:MAG: ArsR/SmtB family transcription factor [Actinomycetota bacterium]
MKDERLGAVFSALGDRTRRRVVERLAAEGEMTATELAEQLPVTRQAIAKHLTTLSEAGLVTSETHGREVRYHLTPAPMHDAVAWMADTGAEWDERLRRLRGRFS